MKQFILLLFQVTFLLSFSQEKFFEKRNISKVEIEILTQDSTLDVRALEIVKSEFVFPVYLTSIGELGILMPNSTFNHVDSLKNRPFYNHKINLSNDTLKLNFRALAIQKNKGYGITIGNPAIIYSLDADLEKTKIVYQENHPKVHRNSPTLKPSSLAG